MHSAIRHLHIKFAVLWYLRSSKLTAKGPGHTVGSGIRESRCLMLRNLSSLVVMKPCWELSTVRLSAQLGLLFYRRRRRRRYGAEEGEGGGGGGRRRRRRRPEEAGEEGGGRRMVMVTVVVGVVVVTTTTTTMMVTKADN